MKRVALIVDDSEAMRFCLVTMMRKAGFSTQCAANGKQALACMMSDTFALIVMDIEMPVMNGMDSVRCLRIIEEAQDVHTPVLGITAGDYSKAQCLQCGMDEILRKPFTNQDLVDAAERLIPPSSISWAG